MPGPSPKSPTSKKAGGAPKAKGAVRAKSGCYTCRIRRKKCDEEPNEQGHCKTCVRLRLQCLGFGAKRPEWLRENNNVLALREKIKHFLASQGMIKGHSGSGPRSADHEPPILRLNEEYRHASSESPPTPTLSLSSDGHGHTRLPSFNNISALRDQTHTPWLPQPLDPHYSVPNQQHGLRQPSPYTSPGPNYAANDILPPYTPPMSHSLVPWNPALCSSFGASYHLPQDFFGVSESEPWNIDDSLQIGPFMGFHDSTFISPSPDEDCLVKHYMNNVIRIQYLLANKSRTAQMIFETLMLHPFARDAVRLLASVHRVKVGQGSRALENGQSRDIYDRLVTMAHNKRAFNKEDAIAALLVISSVLFDGGNGDWAFWLNTAYAFVDFVLQRYTNPADVFTDFLDEKMAFVIKTTLWFDVLASVTLKTPPRYIRMIRDLFDPTGANFGETGPVSMLDVMGCHNDVFWAMSETSSLMCWKELHFSRGTLSTPELVRRGMEIEKVLESHLAFKPPPLELGDEALCRGHTSEIFCWSTLVWLRSIINSNGPYVPEVKHAVQGTIEQLKRIPTHDERIERQIVRSTVFCIFICGCYTTAKAQRDYLVEHLRKQSSDNVGNCTAIINVMQEIWQEWSNNNRSSPVEWRGPLHGSRVLLV